MEEVCARENLKQALKCVKANKGAAGVDGMTKPDGGGVRDDAHPRFSVNGRRLPKPSGRPDRTMRVLHRALRDRRRAAQSGR